nr:unnamed protein product [Spirometra erinaceieuropaei]
MAQRLAGLPVATAAADENVSVKYRWCQLRDKVRSTALAVLGRARRQHQVWPDDSNAATHNTIAEQNRLHRAYANGPTTDNKAAFYRGRGLV